MSASQNDAQAVPLFLFVAGNNPTSLAAYGNIQLALGMLQAQSFALEIINVREFPARALEYRVFVTPTLLAPLHSRRLVGDLSKWSLVHHFLQSLSQAV